LKRSLLLERGLLLWRWRRWGRLLLSLDLLLAHLLLLPWAGLPLERWRRGRGVLRSPVRLPTLLVGVGRLGRWVHITTMTPAIGGWPSRGTRWGWRRLLLWLVTRTGPLGSWRSASVSIRVNIRGLGNTGLRPGASATVSQEVEPGLDMRVVLVKISRPLVCVQSIVDLVVARLVL
jgi:hypothetical protein